MALENILSIVYLDVYDHDTSPSTIKTIALDKQTRIVQAYLYKQGETYNPDASASVELIALRPDKVGVSGEGEVVTVVEPDPDEGTPAIYGVQAVMSQAMLAVKGTVLFQFKITLGDEILRTEIFKANNGVALDAETGTWADEYQGYNLDELVDNFNNAVDEMSRLPDYIEVKVAAAVASRISVQNGTLIINNSDPDVSEVVSELESYVDRKIAQMQTYVDQAVDDKLDVQNNGIYITTQ